MRTSHTFDLLDASSVNIRPLPMEHTHIIPMKVLSIPYAIPLVASSPQPLEAIYVQCLRSILTTNVDQERQNDEHGQGRGRRCRMRHGC